VTALAIPDPARLVLVLARVAGLVVAAPVLGHLSVPIRVRAGFVVVLSLALASAVPPLAEPPATIGALAGALVVESALGALLGFVAQLVFAGVQLGGQFVGIQMGLGMEGLIDPQSQAHVTVVAQWHQLLALLVFLVLDMHHLLVRALVESFRTAPPGGVALSALGLRGAVALGGELFAIGVRIAAPVLVALLLTNGALGVLARTIPQLNVFVVGFPLNVGVGLVVMGAALPFTFRLLAQRFGDLEPTLGALVRGLAHG
jgi:flagellar biosynthetic protein FliR